MCFATPSDVSVLHVLSKPEKMASMKLSLFMQALQDREVCVYSISCKNQTNIDKTIEWLMKHAKS